VWINGISLHFRFQGVLPPTKLVSAKLASRDPHLFDTYPNHFTLPFDYFSHLNLLFRNAESDSDDSDSSEEEKKEESPTKNDDDEPKEETEAQKKQKEMIEKQRKAQTEAFAKHKA
jgi:hypothetical protein